MWHQKNMCTLSQVTCECHVKWVANEKSRKDSSMSKGVTMSMIGKYREKRVTIEMYRPKDEI